MTVKGLKVNSLNMDDDVPGMVLLNTTSFSGVASVSATANTFNATYTNYKIYANIQGASGGDLKYRLRAAGSDLTGSVYAYNHLYFANASQTTFDYIRSTGYTTSGTLGVIGTTQETLLVMELQNVFATKNTSELHSATSLGASDCLFVYGGGRINNTTSYDSITFFNTAGGNINGTFQIYGVNQ